MPTFSLAVTTLSVIVTRSASIVSRPVPAGRRGEQVGGVGGWVGAVVVLEPVSAYEDVACVGDGEAGAPWTISPSEFPEARLPAGGALNVTSRTPSE